MCICKFWYFRFKPELRNAVFSSRVVDVVAVFGLHCWICRAVIVYHSHHSDLYSKRERAQSFACIQNNGEKRNLQRTPRLQLVSSCCLFCVCVYFVLAIENETASRNKVGQLKKFFILCILFVAFHLQFTSRTHFALALPFSLLPSLSLRLSWRRSLRLVRRCEKKKKSICFSLLHQIKESYRYQCTIATHYESIRIVARIHEFQMYSSSDQRKKEQRKQKNFETDEGLARERIWLLPLPMTENETMSTQKCEKA